ncbi:MAG: hypothetical protein QME14_09100 [Methanobacteriaceae archaeon]|nr:hypothetical protein [Methanobacteriaceae archaeon]
MPALIYIKFKVNYDLKRHEFIEGFEEYWKELEYIETLNNELDNVVDESEELKLDSRLFSISFFNFIVIFIISISLLFSILYLNLINLVIDYSMQVSLILIIFLAFRYVFNESNINNAILKFVADRSIFFMVPLLIIFILIVLYNAINA